MCPLCDEGALAMACRHGNHIAHMFNIAFRIIPSLNQLMMGKQEQARNWFRRQATYVKGAINELGDDSTGWMRRRVIARRCYRFTASVCRLVPWDLGQQTLVPGAAWRGTCSATEDFGAANKGHAQVAGPQQIESINHSSVYMFSEYNYSCIF